MEHINKIFSEEGPLSEELEGYRVREGQLELAKNIYSSLVSDNHLLAEAPTGTGKSIAALVPVAMRAKETGQIAVYVTANITLQEQLILKDLPLLQRVLERENIHFKFGLIKGMGNYVCKVALQEAMGQNQVPEAVREINTWAATTTTGDKSELESEYSSNIWKSVSTNTRECLKDDCPVKDCFVFKAKDRAASCQILVTNYHMWLCDLSIREKSGGEASVLPPYDIVVMDEAHDAPGIAMDFHGFQVNKSTLGSCVKGLRKFDRAAKNTATAVTNSFSSLSEKLEARKERILEQPLGFDCNLIKHLNRAAEIYSMYSKKVDDRDDRSKREKAILSARADSCRDAADEMVEVAYGKVVNEEGEVENGIAGSLGDLSMDAVYYVDNVPTGTGIACKSVHPGALFRRQVYSKYTTILMSATLTTRGSFKFVSKQLGLEEGHHQIQVSSPFDPANLLGCIPKEFPDPNSQEHTEEVASWLRKYAEVGEGGVMGLFTSHKALQYAASCLDGVDFNVFVQGTMPKSRIIRKFIESYDKGKKALILATASFWEGVDIPGKALSVVGINKVPFPTPDDPVLYHYDRSGRNSFIEYSIPRSVITLKQGIGRLIRTEEDRGAVVLFDSRVHDRRYGNMIKSAFPKGCFMSKDLAAVSHFIKSR